MSDEAEQFQQRWGFRRNDSDVDSSSNDQSRPTSVSDHNNKPKKRNTPTTPRPRPNKNNKKAVHSPQSQSQSHPGAENYLRDERKAKTSRTEDESFSGVSIDLSLHMESLVEGVKVAREGLLKWMNDELGKSDVPKKTQRRVTKRSKTPRVNNNNPNKARRRLNVEDRPNSADCRSSDKVVKDSRTSHETSEVIVFGNEPAAENNVASGTGTVPVEKNQKPKGKRLGVTPKKQKLSAAAAAAGDRRQTDNDKAPAPARPAPASASASNYLQLPTVLPRQDPENSERTNSEDVIGTERDIRSRNAFIFQNQNQAAINLSPHQQLNFTTPRTTTQQKDGIFSNYPMRNVSDYEQIGNGSVFPFALQSQGLNNGIGMPNFAGQFGLPYLSQESILSGLRVNGGHPMFSTEPHGGFSTETGYGAFNQQSRYKPPGGLMPSSHPPPR